MVACDVLVGFSGATVELLFDLKSVCEYHNATPMEHYLFRRDIAMGWIDPETYGEDV